MSATGLSFLLAEDSPEVDGDLGSYLGTPNCYTAAPLLWPPLEAE
jgi:hypothetical protein